MLSILSPTRVVIIALVTLLGASAAGLWLQTKRVERAQEALVNAVAAKVAAEEDASMERKARLVAEARTLVAAKRTAASKERSKRDQKLLEQHKGWADADVPADLVSSLQHTPGSAHGQRP